MVVHGLIGGIAVFVEGYWTEAVDKSTVMVVDDLATCVGHISEVEGESGALGSIYKRIRR